MELGGQAGEQGAEGSVRFKVDTALPCPWGPELARLLAHPSQRVCHQGVARGAPSSGGLEVEPGDSVSRGLQAAALGHTWPWPGPCVALWPRGLGCFGMAGPGPVCFEQGVPRVAHQWPCL